MYAILAANVADGRNRVHARSLVLFHGDVALLIDLNADLWTD